jgi:hypothetical protein
MELDVGNTFQSFVNNLIIEKAKVDKIRYRYNRMTKQLNLDFWNINSDTRNSLYVGSYGRDTDIVTSDVDWIFRLPSGLKSQYDRHLNNGQSALLQAVKKSIEKTYSKTYLKADGQVIQIPFDDNINFELVPCFENSDGSFTFPDTNNGGSWKKTDPRPEIKAVNDRNNITKGNMKSLCRMARAWKYEWDVPMGGLLIDTLVYKFLEKYEHKDKSTVYYDWMSRDFFKYLSEQNTAQSYWYALGSNQLVYRKGSFEYKAKRCYNISLEAIEKQSNASGEAKKKWREIYGTKFPS